MENKDIPYDSFRKNEIMKKSREEALKNLNQIEYKKMKK